MFLVTARTVVEQIGEVLRHLHHLEGGQGESMQEVAAHSLVPGFFPCWIAQLRNEGLNVAWVPQLSVRAELARGELVVCGGPQWHVRLEIRLYRCALVRKANVRLLWRKLEGGAA